MPDARAWEFLKDNIPLFTCPDPDVETTYYFRWWTYRKHIKQTPAGFIVTEFLKPVNHAGEYNALSCAFGHHLAEGRWLHDRRFLDDYVRFWLRTGPNGGLRANFHQFSGWAAAALYDRWLVDGNLEWLTSCLPALLEDYRAWERERLTESGLFWQRDVSDGMEESISGGRSVKNLRPSINSYMFGNATAISATAALAGDRDTEREYQTKATLLKTLVEQRLWNKDARFFETLLESGRSAQVRESIGFTPWYFGLPARRAGYEIAWKQLMDPEGFYAPFGPTTAERRHPRFQIADRGDDCQWNGPSWPFATTIALRALANVLNAYPQSPIGRRDYFRTLQIYTRSQRLKLEVRRGAGADCVGSSLASIAWRRCSIPALLHQKERRHRIRDCALRHVPRSGVASWHDLARRPEQPSARTRKRVDCEPRPVGEGRAAIANSRADHGHPVVGSDCTIPIEEL